MSEEMYTPPTEELTEDPVINEPDKPKSKKKKRVHSADKHFLDLAKLLLSSLSARACRYAYFNIIPNGFILSNSTKPASGKDAIVYHDRLTEYADSDLCLHFVELKDPDFVMRLKKICGVPDQGIYCVLVTNVIKQFSKTHLDNLLLTSGFGNTKMLAPVGVPYTAINDNYLCSMPVTSFHVCKNLLDWWQGVQYTESDTFKSEIPHAVIGIDHDINVVDRGYSIEFYLDILQRDDGTQVFTRNLPKMRVESIDGIDGVSFKEFIKKVRVKPFQLDMLVWALVDTYIFHMTKFENDVVRVRTLRPNVLLIPLDADTPISKCDLLNLMENTDESQSE